MQLLQINDGPPMHNFVCKVLDVEQQNQLTDSWPPHIELLFLKGNHGSLMSSVDSLFVQHIFVAFTNSNP